MMKTIASGAFLLALGMFFGFGPVGCGDDSTEGDCNDGDMRCTGSVLEECHDGAFHEHKDCADDGQMCHAEMGHCMDHMGTGGHGTGGHGTGGDGTGGHGTGGGTGTGGHGTGGGIGTGGAGGS